MTSRHLVLRGLTYYWRTNTAVVLGVATAVTVLAGALLVGDSVRGSLRDLVLQRLGRTDDLVASSTFFREALAEDLRGDPSFAGRFRDICPIVAVQGLVTDQASGQRALGVQVYGIDDRFWQFHGVAPKPLTATGARREVLLSPALARDIGAQPGGTILVRVQRPSDIPLDSLHGRKDDLGRTVRLTFGGVLSAGELGEFSLRPQQGEVRAAFVPLAMLQQELSLAHRVNAMLLSRASVAEAATATAVLTPESTTAPAASDIETLVRRHTTLEDLGLDVRALDTRGALSVETSGTLISVPLARAAFSAAAAQGMRAAPVFTYLVDSIRLDRSSSRSGQPGNPAPESPRSGADPPARSGSDTPVIPYSLVTAIDLETIAPGVAQDPGAPPPLVLNEWAARNLGAKTGDTVTLDYRAWEDPGILEPRSAAFRLARIVPIEGSAADRDLVPVFPGVTTSENLRDWDPPFPIDLRRIRPIDEDYWHTYRTTPKAFIPFQVGQSLWQSRHGGQTSIRVTPARGVSLDSARQPYVEQLRGRLSPFELGFSAHNARSEGLEASGGATDFGEYFTYFSFFLVASALLLAVLFFKLGVEQRGREVGLLRAVGFTTASVRRLFALEALVVSLAGSVLGLLGAVAYGSLMMAGLRTWWVDAVGTTALSLHVTLLSLAVGGIGGVLAAVASIWWTLRSLKHVSERSLLAGRVAEDSTRGNSAEPAASRRRWSVTAVAALSFLVLGLLLIGVNLAGKMDGTGAFFGAGTALLAACLCGLAVSLRLPSSHTLGGHGWRPLTRLGFRNAAHRPGRSVLSVAVMASATFVLIAVGAFRKDDTQAMTDPHSGTGGYALLVNTMLPIVYDPNSADGRELLGLGDRPDVTVTPFRVLPGDDASCLNLYEPRQPRVIAPGAPAGPAGRFSFQQSLAASPEERANPWLLLDRTAANGAINDGSIPVIADANSMTYVLHKSLGDEMVIAHGGASIRLRLVAALADSVFQGEVIMSEANFRMLFPDQPGYQLLLVDAGSRPPGEVAATIEDRLSDFGADAMPAAQRLAEFHRVENTYLSTFQTLGGLGLLLGTIGLAAVLLRNVLERRRELALLSAVGYRRSDIFAIVIAENAFLLVAGLVVGTVCALVAVAPAAMQQSGRPPVGAGAWLLLFGVLTTGLLSSFIATQVTLRTRLLGALKAE